MVMAAAAAIIFVPPAVILPIGIAQIQCAGIRQSADCSACQCADRSTCRRSASGSANDRTCACANGGTRNRAVTRIERQVTLLQSTVDRVVAIVAELPGAGLVRRLAAGRDDADRGGAGA